MRVLKILEQLVDAADWQGVAAQEHAARAVAAAVRTSMPGEAAWVYCTLGNACQSQGSFSKAIEYHGQDLAIAKEVGDRAGEGGAYGNLGNAYYSLGDYSKAIAYHVQGLSIAKEVSDRVGEGRAYGNLGSAYRVLGDESKAIEYHMQNLAIATEVGDRRGEGRAYGNLGCVYDSLEDYSKAIEYHAQHLAIAKEVGERAGEGRAYGNLGRAYQEGNFSKNFEYHAQHMAIATEVGDRVGEGEAYGDLGRAYRSQGDFGQAIECHTQRLEIAKEVGDRAREGQAYGNLGTCHMHLNERQVWRMTGRVGPRDNKRAGRAAKSSGARGAESTPCHERFHEPVHHLCARGGLPLDTLSTVPLCTRPAQVGGRGGSRRAHLFTGSTVVVSAPHGGPRPWPRPADEGVARTCGAAEQRLDSVLAGQPRPRGDTYSAGLAFRLADSQV
jgi:tetratricopeptide (TPR) repeat protein